MPVHIYKIAQKLGVPSKVVVAKAGEMGIKGRLVPSTLLDKITAAQLEKEVRTSLSIKVEGGLRRFELGNFKAFAATQGLPIRPLTLIFGSNSSGKSSLIHGLLLSCHAAGSGELDVARTGLGGEAVDLGGFRQFVHRRDPSRKVEVVFEVGASTLSYSLANLLGKDETARVTLTIGMPLDNMGLPVAGATAHLISYSVEKGGRNVVRLSRRPSGLMHLDRLDAGIVDGLIEALLENFTTVGTVPTAGERERLQRRGQEVVESLAFRCEPLFPSRVAGDPGGGEPFLPIGRGDRFEELVNAVRLFLPRSVGELLAGINTIVLGELERVRYLGPLRSFPPRHLAYNDERGPNWLAGGGYAWDIVTQEKAVREKVNDWLGSRDRLQTNYRLMVEPIFFGSEVRSSLGPGFGRVAEEILGPLVGLGQAGKPDLAPLVARFKEVEQERLQIEEELAAAADDLAAARKDIAEYEKNTCSLGTADVVPDDPLGRAVREQTQSLRKSAADTLASIRGALEEDERRAEDLRAKLRELDNRKAEVFRELSANVDEDALAAALFEHLERGSRGEAGRELLLLDRRTETVVTHRDVGIGVSQVLPVLVHAYADRGQLVAIEQPEIHLHPALQAELGDLFIESALGENKNTFLLETHSEHLILRILRRVRETTEGGKDLPAGFPRVRPEDVSVVFVEPTAGESVVRVLPVTPDGDFSEPWPGGFFEERGKELF